MTRVQRTNLLLIALLGLAAATLSACDKPLLAETDERSPFDRYDTVRNQYAEQYEMDEFGRRRPNLRGRLLPKD